jgi:uncharacterized membrane protein
MKPGLKPLEEFFRDPALSVACVLLIVVSIAWLIVAPAIARNLRRAEVARRAYDPERHLWDFPPP